MANCKTLRGCCLICLNELRDKALAENRMLRLGEQPNVAQLRRTIASLANAAACAVAEYPVDGASPGMALLRAELNRLPPQYKRHC